MISAVNVMIIFWLISSFESWSSSLYTQNLFILNRKFMQIAVYLLRQGFVLLGNLSITLCRIQKFLL